MPDVEVTRDIVYGEARIQFSTTPVSRLLRLDRYMPATPASQARPALILAFGGAFHRGDHVTTSRRGNTQQYDQWPPTAKPPRAAVGVACSIDYRLVTEDPDRARHR